MTSTRCNIPRDKIVGAKEQQTIEPIPAESLTKLLETSDSKILFILRLRTPDL